MVQPMLRLLPSNQDHTGLSVDEALSLFTSHLAVEGKSSLTIAAYRRDLDSTLTLLEEHIPRWTLESTTEGQLERVLLVPRLAQRSVASLHRLKAALKAFFRWLERTSRMTVDPSRDLLLGRLPRKVPAFLTEPEQKRLLKELRGNGGPSNLRDRTIFELFLGTGIRLAELVALDIEDINLDSKHLLVRSAKGGSPQVKFLKTSLRILLKSYLAERRRIGSSECTALFLSNRESRITARQVARRLDGWLARAGITKPLSPHALRHTFATRLYSRTGDLLMVQKALGHANIATTQIYTHLVDGALEEALERL